MGDLEPRASRLGALAIHTHDERSTPCLLGHPGVEPTPIEQYRGTGQPREAGIHVLVSAITLEIGIVLLGLDLPALATAAALAWVGISHTPSTADAACSPGCGSCLWQSGRRARG